MPTKTLIAVALSACLVLLAAGTPASAADPNAALDKLIAKDIKIAAKKGKVNGVVPAIVTDNNDPAGSHRVKVKFPWLNDSTLGNEFWARVLSSQTRGFFCLPEVDDEVLVMFQHGDIRNPVVLGSVWNGTDRNCSTTP